MTSRFGQPEKVVSLMGVEEDPFVSVGSFHLPSEEAAIGSPGVS